MAAALFAVIPFQLFQFNSGLVGKTAGRPDLAMGMRIRAAHSGAFVLEDLHIAILSFWVARVNMMARWWQCCCGSGPC